MITKEDILTALDRFEFEYFYQPKVSAVTGKIVGAEALARWIKADGEIIAPDAFIPIAEKTGLITRLTLQLFKKLKQHIQILQRVKPLCISFNASVDDLNGDTLTNEILSALESQHLFPNDIELEVTESKLIDESTPLIADNLKKIVHAGVGLAMDDFGTGYSSIQVLADYPFTTLKLDHHLVSGITDHSKKKVIAKTAIRMAHLLKLDIVAEGVERLDQYKLLQHMGCTTLQGYLISRPLPFDGFVDFLQKDIPFSPNIAGTLHMALIDHILWYRDFVRHAGSKRHGAGKTDLSLPVMDPDQCMFGQYFCKLNETILQDVFCSASMEKLNRLHIAFHADAQKIINRLEKADIPVQGVDHMLVGLSGTHMELIRQLESLERSFLTGFSVSSPSKGL